MRIANVYQVSFSAYFEGDVVGTGEVEWEAEGEVGDVDVSNRGILCGEGRYLLIYSLHHSPHLHSSIVIIGDTIPRTGQLLFPPASTP